MINPHGGTLENNLVTQKERETWEDLANTLYSIQIDDRITSNCEMLGNGGFSPLHGFMTKDELTFVVNHMSLPNGLIWSIPIVLPVNAQDFEEITTGADVALFDPRKRLIAILTVKEKYNFDLNLYCNNVYKTVDIAHPGVKAVVDAGNNFLAGNIQLINHPVREKVSENYYLPPAKTR